MPRASVTTLNLHHTSQCILSSRSPFAEISPLPNLLLVLFVQHTDASPEPKKERANDKKKDAQDSKNPKESTPSDAKPETTT